MNPNEKPQISRQEVELLKSRLDELFSPLPLHSRLAVLFSELESLYEQSGREPFFDPPHLAKAFLDGCSLHAGATEIESTMVYVAKVTRADGARRSFTHHISDAPRAATPAQRETSDPSIH